MNASKQVLLGIGAAAALIAAVETLPASGLVFMAVVGVLVLISITQGRRLPLSVKSLAMLVFAWFGFAVGLLGRTMTPDLTMQSFAATLGYFAFFALPASLSVFLLWPRRLASILLFLVVSASVGGAILVAGLEEYLFVRKYKQTGVGPTARWTVPHHWLSYDRETQRLNGAD